MSDGILFQVIKGHGRMVSLQETIKWQRRALEAERKLRGMTVCPTCEGMGAVPFILGHARKCPACDGGGCRPLTAHGSLTEGRSHA